MPLNLQKKRDAAGKSPTKGDGSLHPHPSLGLTVKRGNVEGKTSRRGAPPMRDAARGDLRAENSPEKGAEKKDASTKRGRGSGEAQGPA